MLKFFAKLLIWILAIIVAIVVIGYLTIGYWVKPVVNQVVPQFTKTSAFLGSADISLLSGRVAFKDLKIGNPTGFADPYVFELGEISVQFQPKTVLSNKIIVDQVLIKGTKISTELNKQGQMNLMVLNDNVQASLATQESQTEQVAQKAETKTTTSGNGKTVVIKDLQIIDTSLRMGVMGQMATLTLPNIHEQNIGEKKKNTIGQTISLIMEKLTVESMTEMAQAGKKALNDAFQVISKKAPDKGTVKALSDALSGLF